ncbi:MAG: chemotaxis-specific protein-glutamate methyltransferase CheB [Kofleriaceae bacterium]
MIKVLVVDDSRTVREHLVDILSAQPDFEVVGQADNGRRAVELCAQLRPDVITLDIVMPDMTGTEATEQIMAHHPTPILVVSASFNRGELFDTYAALSAGAVDVIEKPKPDEPDWELRFLSALRMVSKIRVIRHVRGKLGGARVTTTPPVRTIGKRGIEVVAIGASTGGPGALATVLGAIGPKYPLPILVILHIDAQFASAFADWLGNQTRQVVKLATDGEALDSFAGEVRLAPSDLHMTVHHRRIKLIATPPRNHCRPSIDTLFDSLAVDMPAAVAGVVLTGMGRDGASGLAALRQSGAFTIAQDEATSVIYGMPREAVLAGGAERELPIEEIGPLLDDLRRGR